MDKIIKTDSEWRAQLDDLVLLTQGKPNRLATPAEALRVQILVEGILQGK